MQRQTCASGSFVLTSVDRLSSECPGVSKAVDGSTCIFTIDHLESSIPVKLERCSICTNSTLPSHEPIILSKGTTLKLSLGQQPDLCEQAKCPGLRRLLELVLNGCRVKELITVNFDFLPHPESNGDKEEKLNGTLIIRIESVDNGPVCVRLSYPTGDQLCSDDEGYDPLVNPTSDWNPNLIAFWYNRAYSLKQRGTWIIQTHDSSSSDSSGVHLDSWSAAFACYSRALQLASLARAAQLNCTPKLPCPVQPSSEHSNVAKGQSAVGLHSPLDVDHLSDFETNKLDNSLEAFIRLEFSLLLNLALCQLKVGSADSASKLCTQALTQLDPGWVAVAKNSTSVHPSDAAISSHDIAKCLYRRAQSLFAVTKLDEALVDLELASKLQRLDDSPHPGLAATEALMARVRQQLSRDQALLAERLRHRYELFH